MCAHSLLSLHHFRIVILLDVEMSPNLKTRLTLRYSTHISPHYWEGRIKRFVSCAIVRYSLTS
jgi:hypothetical protein